MSLQANKVYVYCLYSLCTVGKRKTCLNKMVHNEGQKIGGSKCGQKKTIIRVFSQAQWKASFFVHLKGMAPTNRPARCHPQPTPPPPAPQRHKSTGTKESHLLFGQKMPWRPCTPSVKKRHRVVVSRDRLTDKNRRSLSPHQNMAIINSAKHSSGIATLWRYVGDKSRLRT